MEDQHPCCSLMVGGKRTAEYVFDALARLREGAPQLKLCGVGFGISRCAEIASTLRRDFGIKSESSQLVTYTRGDSSYTGIEITLSWDGHPEADFFDLPRDDEFIEYPIYHLLLAAHLRKHGKFTVEIENSHERATQKNIPPDSSSRPPRLPALVIEEDGCDFKITVAHALTTTEVGKDQRSIILGDVTAALYRSGMIFSQRWDSVSTTLSKDDDIILGLDTNILRECVVSQQLLDGFIFHNVQGYVHSPNWVLLTIPNGVIHEIEQIANSRHFGGKLTQAGRLGYRALAEILELDQSKDLIGVSLLVVGESDPVLDAKVELRGLRDDMIVRSKKGVSIIRRKLSAGDTHIRDQFKQFLRAISFHKGTYFLTADKSNSALARAEGLRSLYYASAPNNTIQASGMTIKMPRILDNPAPALSVPLAKIIFELAVQFGKIWLVTKDSRILLESDNAGESLIHWIQKRLKIDQKHLKVLLRSYEAKGHFSLRHAEQVWHEINDRLSDEADLARR